MSHGNLNDVTVDEIERHRSFLCLVVGRLTRTSFARKPFVYALHAVSGVGEKDINAALQVCWYVHL